MRKLSMLIIFVVPLVGAMANIAYGQEISTFEERFQLLTEKNIFSINRRVIKFEPEDKEKEFKPKAKKYSSYLLIGISSIDGKWNAFFENAITGHCQILKEGDVFEGGRVEKIDGNGVSYNRGEEVVVLVLGADMKGQTEVPVEYVNEAAETADESGGSESADGDSNSLLQKLLERRKKEMQ